MAVHTIKVTGNSIKIQGVVPWDTFGTKEFVYVDSEGKRQNQTVNEGDTIVIEGANQATTYAILDGTDKAVLDKYKLIIKGGTSDDRYIFGKNIRACQVEIDDAGGNNLVEGSGNMVLEGYKPSEGKHPDPTLLAGILQIAFNGNGTNLVKLDKSDDMPFSVKADNVFITGSDGKDLLYTNDLEVKYMVFDGKGDPGTKNDEQDVWIALSQPAMANVPINAAFRPSPLSLKETLANYGKYSETLKKLVDDFNGKVDEFKENFN